MKRFVPAIIVLIGLLASSGLCQESPKESTGPGPETAQDETDSRFVPPLINKKKGFGFGTYVSTPPLVGSDRKEVVLDRVTRTLPNNFTAGYGHSFSERDRLLVEANLSAVFLGGELSYSYQPEDWNGVFRRGGEILIETATGLRLESQR